MPSRSAWTLPTSRCPSKHSVSATLMDGAALAARLRAELKGEVAEFGHVGLATVLVGDDPASAIYIRNKHRAADEVGNDLEPRSHREPIRPRLLVSLLVERLAKVGC